MQKYYSKIRPQELFQTRNLKTRLRNIKNLIFNKNYTKILRHTSLINNI